MFECVVSRNLDITSVLIMVSNSPVVTCLATHQTASFCHFAMRRHAGNKGPVVPSLQPEVIKFVIKGQDQQFSSGCWLAPFSFELGYLSPLGNTACAHSYREKAPRLEAATRKR
jgi:hypothetical protein